MQYTESWPRCPEATQAFTDLFAAFAARNPSAARLAEALASGAGVDILALVDHWLLPADPEAAARMAALGLEEIQSDGEVWWEHPSARLPRVRLSPEFRFPVPAIGVESVDDFLRARDLDHAERGGNADSNFEYARVELDQDPLYVIARRGSRGFQSAQSPAPADLAKARAVLAARARSRPLPQVTADAADAFRIASQMLGAARAVDEFFALERAYYMRRNTASRWQFARQQALGIGWANHDHHTYRCSREGFRALMQLWLEMGFVARERFYAGAEAGWGAQVLEHPVSRVVLFCDVDMAPEELNIDYSKSDLEPRTELGTIGLWCALHGDSIADAGMHHLEAEFIFTEAETQHRAAGIGVMQPFTDLPVLKQAFTDAEIWSVSQKRAEDLIRRGAITREQAAQFTSHGAPGSHLEILQRWQGFKGFNKTGINHIILQTDARRAS